MPLLPRFGGFESLTANGAWIIIRNGEQLSLLLMHPFNITTPSRLHPTMMVSLLGRSYLESAYGYPMAVCVSQGVITPLRDWNAQPGDGVCEGEVLYYAT